MTPLQLGMPYSRPRYYALGRRRGSGDSSCSFPVPGSWHSASGKPFAGPPSCLLELFKAGQGFNMGLSAEQAAKHAAIAPISAFLDREAAPNQTPAERQTTLTAAHARIEREHPPQALEDQHHASAARGMQARADDRLLATECPDSSLHDSASPVRERDCAQVQSQAADVDSCAPGLSKAPATRERVDGSSSLAEYVPQSVIKQWGQSLDIVSPESKRCNCFTKTYFRWVKASFKILSFVERLPGLCSSLYHQPRCIF